MIDYLQKRTRNTVGRKLTWGTPLTDQYAAMATGNNTDSFCEQYDPWMVRRIVKEQEQKRKAAQSIAWLQDHLEAKRAHVA